MRNVCEVCVSLGFGFLCIAAALNNPSGGVLNRWLEWVYWGAASEGGQILVVRMDPAGERKDLGRRRPLLQPEKKRC